MPTRIFSPERERVFWARVDRRGPSDCWLWLGGMRPEGYGRFSVGYDMVGAHRIAVLLDGRDIPDGTEVDHLCRNRACVNPAHLEVVSHVENMRRATAIWLAKTHCRNGHELTDPNTYTWGPKRLCRECRNRAARDHRRRSSTLLKQQGA